MTYYCAQCKRRFNSTRPRPFCCGREAQRIGRARWTLALERQHWTSELGHTPWVEWVAILFNPDGDEVQRVTHPTLAGLEPFVSRWREVGAAQPTRLSDRDCVLRDPF